MAKSNFKKMRLQEVNDFDLERLLKDVIDTLEDDNLKRLSLIEEPPMEISNDILADYGDAIVNNSAEMIRVTSIITHTDDIYSYFSNGPLFRKDREVK